MYKEKLARSNHETDLDFASGLFGHILMIDDVTLCVKKGKCYDSVDNIEYIAYVSNDVRDVSLHRMSDMSLVVGDGLVLFSRKHKEVFHIHLRCKLCISY